MLYGQCGIVECVLKKNHDLETIKMIGKVISGEIVDDLFKFPL
jgi:hypothetical protein